MYAIVEASGRQYQLEAGRFVDIDLVGAEPGDAYVFERVLMIVNGKESQLGSPWLAGAKVNARVLSHGKARKIIVYKQRPKKGTRKKQGHRQHYTRVFIDSIQLDDKLLAEAKASSGPAPTKAKVAPASAATEGKAEPKSKAKAAPKASEGKSEGLAKAKTTAAPKIAKKKAEGEKAPAKATKRPTEKSDTKTSE